VVVVDIARRAGYTITFGRFLALGFPVMLGSLVLSHLYLWIRFFSG
jgi:Na+/H+ antiporter NhaD/arsenite permease-like protein